MRVFLLAVLVTGFYYFFVRSDEPVARPQLATHENLARLERKIAARRASPPVPAPRLASVVVKPEPMPTESRVEPFSSEESEYRREVDREINNDLIEEGMSLEDWQRYETASQESQGGWVRE